MAVHVVVRSQEAMIVISLIPTLIVPYPFGPMITQAYRQHEAQAGITVNSYLGSWISKHLRWLFTSPYEVRLVLYHSRT